jgi:hypothetical protein
LGLFSTQPLFLGATQAHYTSLAIAAILALGAGVLAVRQGWVRPSAQLRAAFAGLLAAALVYFISVVILGPMELGREGATRYACPFLIATFPAGLRMLAEADCVRRPRWVRGFWVALGGAIIAAFLPSMVARIHEITGYGTPLAFAPTAPEYFQYNQAVLSGVLRPELSGIQARVPPGEPIVAWVMNPYWLDFRRNPILNTDPAGLGMPWARAPRARYFLWEYRGPAVRTPAYYEGLRTGPARIDRAYAVHALAFIRDMEVRARLNEILYDDGWTMLLRSPP